MGTEARKKIKVGTILALHMVNPESIQNPYGPQITARMISESKNVKNSCVWPQTKI